MREQARRTVDEDNDAYEAGARRAHVEVAEQASNGRRAVRAKPCGEAAQQLGARFAGAGDGTRERDGDEEERRRRQEREERTGAGEERPTVPREGAYRIGREADHEHRAAPTRHRPASSSSEEYGW